MTRVLALACLMLPLAVPAFAEDAPAGGYADYVPDTSLYTATSEPPDTELVKRLFTLAFTEACSAAIDGAYGGIEPEVYELSYVPPFREPGDAPYQMRLYQFRCDAGAYNVRSVYYVWDEGDGVAPLTFAVPTVDVKYEDGDTESSRIEALTLLGFEGRSIMTNVAFDPKTQTIVGGAYWRGLGDASELGVWRFRQGQFVLERYEIDASYNGEIDPAEVVNYTQPGDSPAPGRPSFEDSEEE